MKIFSLLLAVGIFGFVVWLILQIPMPGIFRNIIVGVVALFAIVWVLQTLGLVGGIPTLRLK